MRRSIHSAKSALCTPLREKSLEHPRSTGMNLRPLKGMDCEKESVLTASNKEASMGEYARQYTLERYGVYIGDDRGPMPTNKE